MAKITHNVCGRTFRTARGKATHVRCEPTPEYIRAQEQAIAKLDAKLAPAPARVEHDCLEVHPEHAYVDKNGTPRTGHVRWSMGAKPKVSVA